MIFRSHVFLCTYVYLILAVSIPGSKAGPKIPGIRRLVEFIEDRHQRETRRLEEEPLTELPKPDPPRRECGQILELATKEQMTDAITAFVNALFPLDSEQGAFQGIILQALLPAIQYDVQAQVVCSSCDEVRGIYTGEPWLDQNEKYSFNWYCREGSFGADVIQSGLLLIPYDPVTGEQVSGIVKTFIRNKASDVRAHTSAISEVWPDTFEIFAGLEGEELFEKIGDFFDGWPALVAAAAGVVTIAPDYVGYAQSYQEFPQYIIPKYYQRSVSIIFLKSKMIVEQSGCTIVGAETSAGGYSEGGYAAFSGALGLQALSQTIVYVVAGGAPFDTLRQLSWATQNYVSGNATQLARLPTVFSASTLSSVNPDLPNSNVGQDIATDEWLSPTNPFMNILAIQKSELSNAQLNSLIPEPASEIYQEMADKILLQREQGIFNPCATTTPGVDDLLCESLEMGMILQDVEQTTFPTALCHSPEDDVVSIESSIDLATVDNPLLEELSVFGFAADSGSHVENAFVCDFALISRFTSLGIPDVLTGIEPLTNASTCGTQSNSPTISPETGRPTSTSFSNSINSALLLAVFAMSWTIFY